MNSPNSGHEDSRRIRQNIIVLLFLIGLLLGGLWLFSALRAYLRIEACVEAGYRNCDPGQGGAR